MATEVLNGDVGDVEVWREGLENFRCCRDSPIDRGWKIRSLWMAQIKGP